MSDDALLRDLADRRDIEALIHRYCRAVDRIDADLGKSIFHPDATADYSDFYQGSGHGVIEAICESHRHCTVHSHQITTTIITIDGDRAGSEAYHFAAVRMMAGETLMQVEVWGRYLDRWSRRDGRWGIDHRQVIRDLDSIAPATPLSTQVTARRDRDCPSYPILTPAA